MMAGEMAAKKGFGLVVAATEKWGIGSGGSLPWRLKGDMAYFKKVTSSCALGSRNAVIMGRKTWESIPKKFQPLSGRLNIVLTRSVEAVRATVPQEVVVVGDLQSALVAAAEDSTVDKIFVIGGATVYTQALKLPECASVYLTVVKHDFACDTHMPEVDTTAFALDEASIEQVQEGDVKYEYRLYTRV